MTQAERAEQTGIFRHENPFDAQARRCRAGVLAARPAECQQGVTGRRIAATHGNRAYRVRHALIGDLQKAFQQRLTRRSLARLPLQRRKKRVRCRFRVCPTAREPGIAPV